MARITQFEAPVPGQSMTAPPKTYPFDRPPKTVNPEEAADEIFDKLTQPRTAKPLLLMLESGMPISFLTEYLLQRKFAEGDIHFTLIPILAGPVGVMLAAIAKGAGIEPKMEFDKSDGLAKVIARMKASNVSAKDVEKGIELGKASQEAAEELVQSNTSGKGLGAKAQ